jgi:hypothetical protein
MFSASREGDAGFSPLGAVGAALVDSVGTGAACTLGGAATGGKAPASTTTPEEIAVSASVVGDAALAGWEDKASARGLIPSASFALSSSVAPDPFLEAVFLFPPL